MREEDMVGRDQAEVEEGDGVAPGSASVGVARLRLLGGRTGGRELT